jgi:hypothetical protein
MGYEPGTLISKQKPRQFNNSISVPKKNLKIELQAKYMENKN